MFGDPVTRTLVELINILANKGMLTQQDIELLRSKGLNI